MALKKCKECGAQVSDKAKNCPSCGAPYKGRGGCLGCLAIVLLSVAGIVVISAIVVSPSSTTRPQNQRPTIPTTPATPQARASTPRESGSTPATPAIEPHKYEPLPTNAISLTTRSGTSYDTCRITRIEADGITIMHAAGVVRIPYDDLPADFRDRYGFTKQRVEAYRQKTAAAAQGRKAAAQKKISDRQSKIESGFSFWDGSHRGLTRLIKESMNDPKSYEHVKTTYVDMGDYLIVETTFRGKNAFGGLVINRVMATADLDGNVTGVISQDP